MVNPVHDLMLSIQAVRGLPRLRAPGIVPRIISFSMQLPCERCTSAGKLHCIGMVDLRDAPAAAARRLAARCESNHWLLSASVKQ